MLREWSRSDTVAFLRVPGPEDDKYSRGVVALRTGSSAYPGAAVLGVEAAWRAGAGFVRYTGGAADAVLARRPETVAGPDVGRTRVDAWVVGSGKDAVARDAAEERALRAILTGTAPVVVDAGALDLADGATAPLLLTPHAGELARLRALLRLDGTDNGSAGHGSAGHGRADRTGQAERAAQAAETADRLGQVVLLKGSRTLIAAPGGPVIVVASAPGWLATAGAGDVLAGLLGALIAANRGRPLAEIAAAGAWLHGHAARLASGAVNGAPGHPIVALEVAEALPRAIGDLLA